MNSGQVEHQYSTQQQQRQLSPDHQQQQQQQHQQQQHQQQYILEMAAAKQRNKHNGKNNQSRPKKTRRQKVAGSRRVRISSGDHPSTTTSGLLASRNNSTMGVEGGNRSNNSIYKSKKNNSVIGSSFPAFFQKNFSADSSNIMRNAGTAGGADDGRLRTTHKSFYPAARRMIVIGDVHGDLDALIDCLLISRVIEIPAGESLPEDPAARTSQVLYNLINRIKWTGDDTVVIQLGDQIDRIRPMDWHDNQVAKGETYWDEGSSIHIFYMLWYLNYLANRVGGRVISIMGNHEFMNMSGDFRYVSPGEYKEYSDAFRLFYQSRPPHYLAEATAEIKEEIEELEEAHPVPAGYLERRMSYAPGGIMSNFMALHYKVIVQVGSWVFSHAGLTRQTSRIGTVAAINNSVSRCLLGPRVSRPDDQRIYNHIVNCRSEDSPIWTRVYGDPGLHSNSSANRQRIADLDAIFKEYNTVNKRYHISSSSGANNSNNDHDHDIVDASATINNTTDQNIPSAAYIAVGHTPQAPKLGGINSGLDGRVWRCDVGMSRAFGPKASKRAQVLEVLEDGAVINVLRRS